MDAPPRNNSQEKTMHTIIQRQLPILVINHKQVNQEVFNKIPISIEAIEPAIAKTKEGGYYWILMERNGIIFRRPKQEDEISDDIPYIYILD